MIIVVLYGALLRFDALTLTYGPVERPGWLRAVQDSRSDKSVLRLDSFRWAPHVGRYISDPYTYLRYAREMRSFYAAHRREPVFPFATKVWLWLLDDQDVAVSFASAAFSVLAIVATYLLGSYAFTRWVGLLAAAAVAIEYDIITWGVGGWRDDAFMCAVVLSAYAMVRVAREPSGANALLLGTAAGFACLVRITSLSFLVPGLLYVAVMSSGDRRRRMGALGIAIATGVLIAAPYLINCWRTFGDPLYAINVHADIYREAQGQKDEQSQSAAEFLRENARRRPVLTLETAVLGMTTYPFLNKWQGFERWGRPLVTFLLWASLVGLFLFIGSSTGRLLLLVVAASLVPYAMTWRLIGDWRFTEHAYPFFLIAAAFTLVQVVKAFTPQGLRAIRRPAVDRRRVRLWAAAAVLVAAVVWTVTRILPAQAAREALIAGESVTLGGGPRDGVFFGDGWAKPVTQGNVKARVSDDRHAVVLLPLPRVQDYLLTLRLDPFPPPLSDAETLPTVHVSVNDRLVAILELRWNPERVGSYEVRVPAAAVNVGTNRLKLTATRTNQMARVRLWHVRVHPVASTRHVARGRRHARGPDCPAATV